MGSLNGKHDHDRDPRQKRGKATPRKRAQPHLESLERRELLASGDGFSTFVPDVNAGIADIKRGPMAMAGEQLIDIYVAYQNAINTNVPFQSPYGDAIYVRGNMVGVTISAGQGTVDQLKTALTNLGMEVSATDANRRLAEGYLPISALPQLVKLPQVVGVRAIYRPVVDQGVAMNDAYRGMRVDVARNTYGVNGAGVKIGALSDSVNQLAGGLQDSISTGDLPANVEVLLDGNGGTDEGRAMLELIYDLAPGSNLAFHTAGGGEIAFGNGIRALAQAGAGVIVDDVKYLSEPFFQDGIVASAVAEVVDDLGVTYFSSAGNYGDGGYSGLFRGMDGAAGGVSGRFMDFDPSAGTSATIPITVFQSSNLILQWDDPFYVTNGVKTDLDILFLDSTGALISRSNTNNIAQGDPLEITTLPANATQIAILVAGGVDPGRVRFVAMPGVSMSVSRNFGNDNGNITYGTTFGHAVSDRAIGTGAVPYWVAPAYGNVSPLPNEIFSSHGPVQIAFNPDGTRKSAVDVRQSPIISALDGTNTSFFGFDIDTTSPPPGTGPATSTNFDTDTNPNFFGTSAAAPTAAAVAALMKQLSPNATYQDIRAGMIASALPLNGSAKGQWNTQGGYGLVMADAALGAIDTLRVVTATPGAGQTVTTSPNAVVVTFSRAIDATTIQAGDLVFSQVPTGVNLTVGNPVLLNPTTVSFPLNVTTAPGVKANGSYTYQLGDGSINSADGRPLVGYTASFNLADVTNPWITNTIVLGRVMVVDFSEAMRPSTINASTVLLERQISANTWELINSRPGLIVYYDAPNNRVNIDLNRVDQKFLPSGQYRITVSDTVTDLVGNRLDGEFNGTFPTGNRRGLPTEDFDGDPFVQLISATLTAPRVTGFGLEQTSGPAVTNPRIIGTRYNRRAVEVYFSQPMDPASINRLTVSLTRTGTNTPDFSSPIWVSGDSRVSITYDAVGNRAIIDLSRLDDEGALPDDVYAVSVSPNVRDRDGNLLDGEFRTSASAIIPLNDGVTGRDSLFPSGDGKPVSQENADNDQFTQILPDLLTSGSSQFISSDSGIAGDQNTNVTRPWFTGSVGSMFPGAVGGLAIAVQFNGPRLGTFDLDVGPGGRGYRGNPDLIVYTDANGRFRFQAPMDLPDGFNTVRIVAIGQADLPPLPGFASRSDRSFRVDTTTPQVTTTVAPYSRLSSLTNLSLNIVDPILPTSPFDLLGVPPQLLLPALDPTSASNISNYTLVNLGADNAVGGDNADADIDYSSFIIGATFVSTTNRVLPGDPYTGRVDLSFATGLPSGRYVLTARRPQPGFNGITDAAGNPIDGDPGQPGAQDFTLVVDLQPQAAFLTGVKAISPLADGTVVDLNQPSTFIASDPRSHFELPATGKTPRADAPPVAFFLNFSNPLDPASINNNTVRLIRTANSALSQPDGDFGLDNSFTLGAGYTEITGLNVSLADEIPGTSFGQPGYRNQIRVELPAGTVLAADSYRLFLPNVGATTITDTFGNTFDGEFLGNSTPTGGFETLMPDGSLRPGLTGDGVGGGAFLTSYVVVPNGNVIYARPDYVDDPFLSADDPDGSLARPYPTLAPEAQPNALNGGDLNSVVNFGTGFDSRLDRNQNGHFDRSAFYAAEVASANGPVVIIALPGAQQRDPVTGVTTQKTFVLAAPAGGIDPIRNNASASVPFNTTLVFSAGSTLKMQNASLFAQNQGTAIQTLGGFNPEERVNFTSFSDDSIGGDTNNDGAPGIGGNTPSGGDWGGIIFRNYDQSGRVNRVPFPVDDRLKGPNGTDARSGADDGMSIINYANLRYGGGPVPRTLGDSNGPVTLFNSRPAINNSRISDSKMSGGGVVSGTVGAITADFDSFREDELARGPLVRNVELINNSINAIFIRAELSGTAHQTNAIAYPNNPATKGGSRNFTIDDPLPHVLTTRLVVGEQELQTTGGLTQSVTNRLYIQPGMMFKMTTGSAIDTVTPGASINIGDRTYINQFDNNPNLAPTDPGFRAPTVSDARVLFTSFYDDAATTYFRDPNTGLLTTIVSSIDTDNGGPIFQPSPGQPVAQQARWGGLGVQSGARAVIDEAEFRFGGGSVNFPGLTVGQRDVLNFQGAGGTVTAYDGINKTISGARGTTAYVTNNDFHDNLQAPIGISPNGLLAADPARPLLSGNPFFRGNIMVDNQINAMEVIAGQGVGTYDPNLFVDSVWDDYDVIYALRGSIRLDGARGNLFPSPDLTQFTAQLRPFVSLTLQSGLPDTVLADGSRIARPGESLMVKLLGGGPGDIGGSTSDNNGGAGFMVGIDDLVDPPNDPFVDPGAFSQIRFVGIGGNETTGQQRVPVVITSLRDQTAFKTVRGVTMGDAQSPTINGNTTAPAAGDGGLIYFGGLSLTDYNLYDPRDGNIIDNADIRYITRIEQQGGGIVYNGTGRGDKLGLTPETQFNSARALAITNSNLANFRDVGVLAHPGGAALVTSGGSPIRTTTPLDGMPTLTYLANNTIANMPVGVRIVMKDINDDQFQQPAEAVFLHNTFYNNPIGISTVAPAFNGAPNRMSHVFSLVMNNIFDGSSTVGIDVAGQAYGSQGQFNLFANTPTPSTGAFTNSNALTNATSGLRDPANGDFSLTASSDAIDSSLSELGQNLLGNSLRPIATQILNVAGGIRNATGRTNPFGGWFGATGSPGDIITLPGFPSRTYEDQWIPAIPGTPGAVSGPSGNAGGTYWWAPIGGERDQNGYLRVDDPTVARIGAGSRPFFDIGSQERRIIIPPRVTDVTAVFADPSSSTGVRTQNFYSVGGLAGSNQSPLRIQVRFDNRLDPATLNSSTVILQASGGDGIFGNNNNSADRTIDLSGKLSYNASTLTLTITLSGITPSLSNDQFRVILFGNGSDVIRDPQGVTLDGENTAGGLPDGAQLALPSGDGLPGGNFYLGFSIDSSPPTIVGGSLRLDPASDTGRPNDNITNQGMPSFTGTIDDSFPPANPLVGQTVYLDYAGLDGVFGRLLADGTLDPTDPAGADDRLNVGTALTGANGVFTVTVGQDGASTGLVPPGVSLPETNVNVGTDGWLGPHPVTGVNDDVLSTYGLARVRVVDQSGNASDATAAGSRVRFVVDTFGPRITSANPAPGSQVSPTNGSFPVIVTTNENVNPSSLNAGSIVVLRSGGDGIFGNGNDVALSVSAASILATPITGSTTGAMRISFSVNGATVNDVYRVSLLGSGSSPVADWAGNALNGEFNGTFPTGSGGNGGDFHLGFIVMSPNNVTRTVFVDDDAPLNANATGTALDPFKTIMGVTLPGPDGQVGTPDDLVYPGAMQVAGVGDTIAVLPGVYNEAIVLKSLVRLVSAGLGSTEANVIPGQALQTVLRAPASTTGGSTIGVTAIDVLSLSSFATEVRGFTIMVPLVGNTANGPIDPTSMGVLLSNSEVLISGNYIINAAIGVGINANGQALPASPRLESNVVVGNLTGIVVDGTTGSGFADGTPIQITNNTIAFNNNGLVLNAGNGYRNRTLANVDNNIFSGNFAGTTTRTGSAVFNAAPTIVNFRGNLFSNNGKSQTSNKDDVVGASTGTVFDPSRLSTTPDRVGNFVGNPGFANPRDPRPSPQGQGPAVFFLDANFDLNSVSDALDTAYGPLAPTKDFRSRGRVDLPGHGRRGWGPADIGAFERNGTGGIPGIGGSGAVLNSALTTTRGIRERNGGFGSSIDTAAAGRTVAIKFSTAVDRTSVQASDLILSGALASVNPARATGLAWVDNQTVHFTLSGNFKPTGEVSVEIPEGAIRAADGKPIKGYNAVLRQGAAQPAAVATRTAQPAQAATVTPVTNRQAARESSSVWARFLRLRRR